MTRPGTLARAMAFALLSLCLATSWAPAQQRLGPGQRTQDRQQLERRVRARFAQSMHQRLGLSAEEAQRLDSTVESFMERRQKLVADEQALRGRMAAIAAEQEPSEAEARTVIARMQELREEEVRLFRAEHEALLRVLTPVQLVRFHAMREQLGQRIQQLRGGMGPMTGPPAGRRGGPPPEGDWPDQGTERSPGALPWESPGP